MITQQEALQALHNVDVFCEEKDWNLIEDQRTGYRKMPDMNKLKEYILHSIPIEE